MKLNKYESGLLATFVFMFVLAVFLFAYVMPAKAMSISEEQYHFTGGSECHAYSTSTTVIQPVYDYCQNVKGSGAVEQKKRSHSSVGANKPTVQDTPENPTVDKPTNKPTQEPPIITDNKKHCNNGEGNGSEGCSPAQSPHANNDENNTTPKEDKSNK